MRFYEYKTEIRYVNGIRRGEVLEAYEFVIS